MDALVEYTIPIKGLGKGMHEFNFKIDQAFFRHFEQSPIKGGAIDLKLNFDKGTDMHVLDFEFEGIVETICDRCLDPFELEVAAKEQLLVKLSAEERPEEAEVIYISPELSKFNVAKYAYEFICLSLPLIKVHPDIEDCNPDMIAHLDGQSEKEPEETSNPIWEELKKFKTDS